MKKIILIVALTSIFTGCATTKYSNYSDMQQCRTGSVNCGSC